MSVGMRALSSEEVIWFPGSGVEDGCEQPCGC